MVRTRSQHRKTSFVGPELFLARTSRLLGFKLGPARVDRYRCFIPPFFLLFLLKSHGLGYRDQCVVKKTFCHWLKEMRRKSQEKARWRRKWNVRATTDYDLPEDELTSKNCPKRPKKLVVPSYSWTSTGSPMALCTSTWSLFGRIGRSKNDEDNQSLNNALDGALSFGYPLSRSHTHTRARARAYNYTCCNFLCVVLAAAYLKFRRCRLSCLPFAWHLFACHSSGTFFIVTHTHARTHAPCQAHVSQTSIYVS